MRCTQPRLRLTHVLVALCVGVTAIGASPRTASADPIGPPPAVPVSPTGTLQIAPEVVQIGTVFTASLTPKPGYRITKVFWSGGDFARGGPGGPETAIPLTMLSGCRTSDFSCTYRVGRPDADSYDPTAWYFLGVSYECRKVGDPDYCVQPFTGDQAWDVIGFRPDPRPRYTVNRVSDERDANTADGRCDVVANTGTPDCTLRAAIEQANARTGAEVIDFALPDGKTLIQPRSALPVVTGPVTITAEEIHVHSAKPRIDGALVTAPGVNGLVLRGGDSRVTNLRLTRWTGAGLRLEQRGHNRVEGSFFGTDGTARLSNRDGLVIDRSDDNVIGGSASELASVFSGNGDRTRDVYGTGITVLDSLGTAIHGGRIGTDRTGSLGLGNHGWGILVGWRGTTPARTGAGTVIRDSRISGNTGGIAITGGTAATGGGVNGTRLYSSAIGTVVPTGTGTTTSISPQSIGVLVYGKAANTDIGGSVEGTGNRVGNNTVGIVLAGQLTGSRVRRAYVGIDPTGTKAEPNGVGIIGAGGPFTIGSTVEGAGNRVAGNRDAEVVLLGTRGAKLLRNMIGTNGSGTARLGTLKGKVGVLVTRDSTDTVIGTPGNGNVISGEEVGLVVVDGARTTIQGNGIGTNAARSAKVPNALGVFVWGAQSVLLGGAGHGAGNVVSGNTGPGVAVGTSTQRAEFTPSQRARFDDYLTSHAPIQQLLAFVASRVGGVTPPAGVTGATRTPPQLKEPADIKLLGNRIGTDRGGTVALANGNGGVVVDRGGALVGATTGTTPGGACTGACNLISGNAGDGVSTGSARLLALGNLIGTDVTGKLALGNTGHGIASAGNTTVGAIDPRGRNLVSGNGGAGLFGAYAGITGNRVGTDTSGATAIPNRKGGILISGTLLDADGMINENLVSGNHLFGLRLGAGPDPAATSGSNANDYTIVHNTIGLAADGRARLGNGGHGVWIYAPDDHHAAYRNLVGIAHFNATNANLIAGNAGDGIRIEGSGARENDVWANWIGVDASGTCVPANGVCPTGNGGDGIAVVNAHDAVFKLNVVSGNVGHGIRVTGRGGPSPLQERDVTAGVGSGANSIGADANGRVIGNGGAGVYLRDVVFASFIGDDIVGNRLDGVSVTQSGSYGDSFGNTIWEEVPSPGEPGANGGLPVDLADDGPTPNDPNDSDSGPNRLQNHPVWVVPASSGGGTLYPTRDQADPTTVRVPFFFSSRGSGVVTIRYSVQFFACSGAYLGFYEHDGSQRISLPIGGEKVFRDGEAAVLRNVPSSVTAIKMVATYIEPFRTSEVWNSSEMSPCQPIR